MQRFSLQSPGGQSDRTGPGAAFIVLIEDNPGDVLLVREALHQHEVAGDVLVLSDGEKAIDFFQNVGRQGGEYPDLVIVDLSLPKRSGLEVLPHIQPGPSGRKAAVVVLSSSNTPRDRAESERLGADMYLQKPSRLEEFMGLGAVLKSVLLRQSGSL